MPCNGIAVATVKCAVPEVVELLTQPENLAAVATLLKERGHNAVIVNKTLIVNNVAVSIRGTTVSAKLPQRIVQDIRQAIEEMAGVLTQYYVANIIQENTIVTSQTYSNGYLVLQVNL